MVGEKSERLENGVEMRKYILRSLAEFPLTPTQTSYG